MKAVPLTDETADTIIKLMEEPLRGYNCCASVRKTGAGGAWANRWEACYRPPASELLNSAWHPDHFGIPFFGAGAGGCGMETRPAKDQYSTEAEAFLSACMAPDGAFKEVLPHLYHATAKEVWKDKGFVVKDALAMKSPGLLWTFLQAVRMIWEHQSTLPIFVEASQLTKDPQVALFASLSLMPSKRNNYANARGCLHGDALGSVPGNPIRLRKSFLQGIVAAGSVSDHKPYESWSCFPTDEPHSGYRFAPTLKPLAQWLKEFEEIRAQRSPE